MYLHVVAELTTLISDSIVLNGDNFNLWDVINCDVVAEDYMPVAA